MRRLAPWLLLSMVLAGAGVGALLGAMSHPARTATPSQWVADALAATKGAGTAHFSYSSVTTSPNPDLWGNSSGHGVVDFTAGNLWVTEVDRSVNFASTGGGPTHPQDTTNTVHSIVIRGTVYEDGFGPSDRYNVLHPPKVLVAQGPLSLVFASTALDSLTGEFSAASVTPLGSTQIGGADVTEYRVNFDPLRVCPPRQAPKTITQLPSRVWIDDAGRVVRVRSTTFFDDRLPRGVKLPAGAGAADVPQGPETTVNTLTFSQFGAPVHITAPPADEIQSGGVSILVAKSDACRS